MKTVIIQISMPVHTDFDCWVSSLFPVSNLRAYETASMPNKVNSRPSLFISVLFYSVWYGSFLWHSTVYISTSVFCTSFTGELRERKESDLDYNWNVKVFTFFFFLKFLLFQRS